tara:strand:+ start:1486 stop:1809 length:324 start_codon:yes stop_codon:yes gene_type:complete
MNNFLPIKVKVTKDDIKYGTRNCPENCAIAIALENALGNKGYFDANVDSSENITISWGNDNRPYDISDYLIHTNDEDQRNISLFMDQFDKGNNVEPFTFTIQMLEEC